MSGIAEGLSLRSEERDKFETNSLKSSRVNVHSVIWIIQGNCLIELFHQIRMVIENAIEEVKGTIASK